MDFGASNTYEITRCLRPVTLIRTAPRDDDPYLPHLNFQTIAQIEFKYTADSEQPCSYGRKYGDGLTYQFTLFSEAPHTSDASETLQPQSKAELYRILHSLNQTPYIVHYSCHDRNKALSGFGLYVLHTPNVNQPIEYETFKNLAHNADSEIYSNNAHMILSPYILSLLNVQQVSKSSIEYTINMCSDPSMLVDLNRCFYPNSAKPIFLNTFPSDNTLQGLLASPTMLGNDVTSAALCHKMQSLIYKPETSSLICSLITSLHNLPQHIHFEPVLRASHVQYDNENDPSGSYKNIVTPKKLNLNQKGIVILPLHHLHHGHYFKNAEYMLTAENGIFRITKTGLANISVILHGIVEQGSIKTGSEVKLLTKAQLDASIGVNDFFTSPLTYDRKYRVRLRQEGDIPQDISYNPTAQESPTTSIISQGSAVYQITAKENESPPNMEDYFSITDNNLFLLYNIQMRNEQSITEINKKTKRVLDHYRMRETSKSSLMRCFSNDNDGKHDMHIAMLYRECINTLSKIGSKIFDLKDVKKVLYTQRSLHLSLGLVNGRKHIHYLNTLIETKYPQFFCFRKELYGADIQFAPQIQDALVSVPKDTLIRAVQNISPNFHQKEKCRSSFILATIIFFASISSIIYLPFEITQFIVPAGITLSLYLLYSANWVNYALESIIEQPAESSMVTNAQPPAERVEYANNQQQSPENANTKPKQH